MGLHHLRTETRCTQTRWIKPTYLTTSMNQSTQEDEGDIPCLDGQPYPSMPDITVTKEGVEKLLKKINPNKACGPDMIPARIL